MTSPTVTAAQEAVALAIERFGRLDILVNNAARFLLKPTLETSDEEWDAVLRTNVRGVFAIAARRCRTLPRAAEARSSTSPRSPVWSGSPTRPPTR